MAEPNPFAKYVRPATEAVEPDNPFAKYVQSAPLPEAVAAEPAAPDMPRDSLPSPDAPLPEGWQGPQEPEMGAGPAFGIGAAQGATMQFGDELIGLGQAGGGGMSDLKRAALTVSGIAPVVGAGRIIHEAITRAPGEATSAYESGRNEWRGLVERGERQHPYWTGAGQFTGAVAAPVGIARLQGVAMGIRMLRGMLTGATVGGVSGVGQGTTPEERAIGGATGATFGAGIGMVAPPVVAGATWLGGKIAAPIAGAVRRWANPAAAEEAEAARQVAQAVETAQARGGRYTMPRPEFERRAAEGEPVANIDLAGTQGRRLARTAKNLSDEAEEELQGTLAGRASWEAERTASFIDRLAGSKGLNVEGIRAAAAEGNSRAYKRAYTEGEAINRTAMKADPESNGAFWTPELQRIARSPTMREIMLSIGPVEGDRSIIAGFRFPRPNPFSVGKDGALEPKVRTTFSDGSPRTLEAPDLQAWDSVQRVIRGMIGEAERNPEKARRYTLLHKALVDELDKISPRFAEARGTAFRGFRAEDAYEAGRNYVTMSASRREARDMQKAIQGFSAQDRVLFMHGFTQSLIARVLEKSDSTATVNRIANSPAARARIVEALGKNRAKELEAYLHVLKIEKAGQRAVEGNSSTGLQLSDIADFGRRVAGEALAPVATGAVYGTATGNWDWGTLLAGGTVAGVRSGYRRTNRAREQRIAAHVGRMLSSSDPDAFRKGIAILAGNERMMERLRNFGEPLGTKGLPPQLPNLTGMQGSVRVGAEQEQ